jgi:hypothetical protein
MGGSLRFSETGAAFFSDMFSKHALHSRAAEEVLYAGGCGVVVVVVWLRGTCTQACVSGGMH